MLNAVGTVGLSWCLRWSLRDHGIGREVKRQAVLDLWVMEKCRWEHYGKGCRKMPQWILWKQAGYLSKLLSQESTLGLWATVF